MKPGSGKILNCLIHFLVISFLFFFFFVLSKKFTPRQFNQRSRFCCVNNNNTNELHYSLVASFDLGEKQLTEQQIIRYKDTMNLKVSSTAIV